MSIFSARSAPLQTVERYIAASNANDIAAARALMAEDFRVIDSAGDWVAGRDNVVEAMRRFFIQAPDFHIQVIDMSSRGNQVFIRGQSSCSDMRFTGEELWRAEADERYMLEWQSYSRAGSPHLTRILMPELLALAR